MATEAGAAPSCKTVFEEEKTAFKASLNSGALPEALRYDNLMAGLETKKQEFLLNLKMCIMPMVVVVSSYAKNANGTTLLDVKENNTVEHPNLRMFSDDNYDEKFAEAYQKPEMHDKMIHMLRQMTLGPGMSRTVSDEQFLACFEKDDMEQAKECYTNLVTLDKAQATGFMAEMAKNLGTKEVDWSQIPDDAAVKAIDLIRNHVWEGFQAFRGARCIMPIARHCGRVFSTALKEMPEWIKATFMPVKEEPVWTKDEAEWENPRVATPDSAKAQHGPVNVAISIHVSGSQEK